MEQTAVWRFGSVDRSHIQEPSNDIGAAAHPGRWTAYRTGFSYTYHTKETVRGN